MNKKQRIRIYKEREMVAAEEALRADLAYLFIVCKPCGKHMGGIKRHDMREIDPDGTIRYYYQPSNDGAPGAPIYGNELAASGAQRVECAGCGRVLDVPVAQLRSESELAFLHLGRDLHV